MNTSTIQCLKSNLLGLITQENNGGSSYQCILPNELDGHNGRVPEVSSHSSYSTAGEGEKSIAAISDQEELVNPTSNNPIQTSPAINPVLIEEIAEDTESDVDEDDEVFKECLAPDDPLEESCSKTTVITQPNSSLDPLANTYRVILIRWFQW